MRILIAFLLLLSVPAPLWASQTLWQDVAPDVKMRLVASNSVTPEGTTWIGLEIEMPDDTKTYWRVPGESGIPAKFDFARSQGLTGHTVAWPMPMRETDKGYIDHVYYGHTVLPLELNIDADEVLIDVDIVLGICSDVCVPVAAQFTQHLDFAQPDRANGLRIDQARALVPVQWNGQNDLFGAASFDAEARTIMVAVEPAGYDMGSVIAHVANSMALFGPPEVDETNGVLIFPLLGNGKTAPRDGDRLHLTFLTGNGAYEVVSVLDF